MNGVCSRNHDVDQLETPARVTVVNTAIQELTDERGVNILLVSSHLCVFIPSQKWSEVARSAGLKQPSVTQDTASYTSAAHNSTIV